MSKSNFRKTCKENKKRKVNKERALPLDRKHPMSKLKY
ncbi:hypothetical protein BMQ_pBM60055 (plasmid) [Priestia megaterium QM B1551]|uniref:Uncharacterized protein n=1 Tax=Priestia megaterium (strain ATCC 12872 / QMB1551) TaxID=545693 RepID=D5E3W2_PRIM1|nr:hypothetical protein BMQ_pBM60055 [Priestia megaterium QM B1551]